jgi:L-threonylcarbamoyladenylate synthase
MMSQISNDIHQAVAILKSGGLVAIPTETVYGLAADASNPTAVKKIFAAKGRPADHPLIVHLADAEQVPHWAIDVPAEAYRLFAAFWPGPLTVICKKAPHVIPEVTGGQDTVGLRVPSHPIAHELLTAFGGGLAAPSANRFGRISPTDASHVQAELGDAVDLILEGGRSEVGIESTIVDLSSDEIRILRPGMISEMAISRVLGHPVPVISKAANAPRVSGSLASHYAPVTPCELVENTNIFQKIQGQQKCVIISHLPITNPGQTTVITLPNNPLDYAYELYAALRQADSLKADRIFIVEVPQEWTAIIDRLSRAAHRS